MGWGRPPEPPRVGLNNRWPDHGEVPPLPKLEGVTFGWDGEDWMFCSDLRGGWLAARSLKVAVPFSAKLEPRKRFCRSSSSSSKAGCGLRFCCIVANQQNVLVSKGKRGVRRQRLEMKIEFPIENWGIGIRPTTELLCLRPSKLKFSIRRQRTTAQVVN